MRQYDLLEEMVGKENMSVKVEEKEGKGCIVEAGKEKMDESEEVFENALTMMSLIMYRKDLDDILLSLSTGAISK